MDDHHLTIIRLAWARHLGLGDRDLRPGKVTRAEGPTIHVLELAGSAAIVGPRWFLDRTSDNSVTDLLTPATLLRLTREIGGRLIGPEILAFLGDYPAAQPVDQALISHERDDALFVAASCPPDDTIECALADQDRWLTALGDNNEPTACAAYAERQGLLADIVTLIPANHRNDGIGAELTCLAAEDALDAGLIPQLRSIPGATPATDRARFEALGTYARVEPQLPI